MPKDVKIKEFTGTFDFPFEVPVMLREMDDNRIGFELLVPFEALVARTPECNDFRQLGTKEWVAYSTMMDKEQTAVRATGDTIYDALVNLREKLGY